MKDVKIICSDGFELAATLYTPSKVNAAIMIAPATGIKKSFYASFAKYLCENGFAVLTYDNRGIGQSKGTFDGASKPSLTNWGILDMTAVLEYLKNQFPSVSYHLIGHSAGGQLVGLMKNAQDLKSMFNFASSSGSLTNMTLPFKISASFFLNVFIPINNLLFGKTNSQWVGMGEPLPKGVAKEWRKWCNGKGYVYVDLNSKIKNHLYNELDFDTFWVHATDDKIANYENVKDMVRVFSKINHTILTLSPADYGFKDIGHMKFFSSKKSQLWPLALEWFNKNLH